MAESSGLLNLKMVFKQWVPLNEIKKRMALAETADLNRIINGVIPDSPIETKPTGPVHHWVEVRLSEYAYAMLEYDYIKTLNKSSACALADRLSVLVMKTADTLKGLDYGQIDIQKNGPVNR